MAMVGVPLVAVTVLQASTFAVSALTAAAWLPWLVIGLPAGAWVDRLDARRVMIGCDVVSAALYASVPITAWAGVLSTGLVVVIQLLAGAASVLFMTAYQVYLPSVVTPDELVEGNTKMQGSASAAAFAGRAWLGWSLRCCRTARRGPRYRRHSRRPDHRPRHRAVRHRARTAAQHLCCYPVRAAHPAHRAGPAARVLPDGLAGGLHRHRRRQHHHRRLSASPTPRPECAAGSPRPCDS